MEAAWGPMPQDVLRDGGEAAIHRALDWLVRRDPAALEPALEAPAMAFNLTVLSSLLGTPLEPDFAGVDLLIEDVERAALPDRPHDVPCHRQRERPAGRPAAARAGRDILPNEPEFAGDEAAIVEDWCAPLGHRVRRPRGHRPRCRQQGRAVPARKTDLGCLWAIAKAPELRST